MLLPTFVVAFSHSHVAVQGGPRKLTHVRFSITVTSPSLWWCQLTTTSPLGYVRFSFSQRKKKQRKRKLSGSFDRSYGERNQSKYETYLKTRQFLVGLVRVSPFLDTHGRLARPDLLERPEAVISFGFPSVIYFCAFLAKRSWKGQKSLIRFFLNLSFLLCLWATDPRDENSISCA